MLSHSQGDYEGNNKKPSKMRTRRMSWIYPNVIKSFYSTKNFYTYAHIDMNKNKFDARSFVSWFYKYFEMLPYVYYCTTFSFKNLNMISYEGLIGRPFSPGLSRTSIYALCIIPVPNDTTIWLMVYLLKGFFGHIYWCKWTLVSHLV